MKDQPLFSVIMPNHNKGKYIREAIESVRAQNYPRWELIIVDDASTDNSLDVIETFSDDIRIKAIKNSTNRGVGYVSHQAVENSSGEIIGTLDSDDILHPDALTVMANEHMTNPDCGLIYSNLYICDGDLKISGELDLLDSLPAGVSLQEILMGGKYKSPISLSFRTFKRSAYDKTEGYDTGLRCYVDRDLYYKLEKKGKIKCVNRCLYYYRHPNDKGVYRNNPRARYYKLFCEYKEIKRRLGVDLPFVDKENISPWLLNIMYIYMKRYLNIRKKEFRYFFLEMGYYSLTTNKLLALLYFLNSMIYGYTPITLSRIRKFFSAHAS